MFVYGSYDYSKNLISNKKSLLHDEFREVMQDLKSRPKKYLLLIKYRSVHHFLNEFVYNSSDLSSQQVIIARSLTPEKDNNLIKYYNNREALFLEFPEILAVDPSFKIKPANNSNS